MHYWIAILLLFPLQIFADSSCIKKVAPFLEEKRSTVNSSSSDIKNILDLRRQADLYTTEEYFEDPKLLQSLLLIYQQEAEALKIYFEQQGIKTIPRLDPYSLKDELIYIPSLEIVFEEKVKSNSELELLRRFTKKAKIQHVYISFAYFRLRGAQGHFANDPSTSYIALGPQLLDDLFIRKATGEIIWHEVAHALASQRKLVPEKRNSIYQFIWTAREEAKPLFGTSAKEPYSMRLNAEELYNYASGYYWRLKFNYLSLSRQERINFLKSMIKDNFHWQHYVANKVNELCSKKIALLKSFQGDQIENFLNILKFKNNSLVLIDDNQKFYMETTHRLKTLNITPESKIQAQIVVEEQIQKLERLQSTAKFYIDGDVRLQELLKQLLYSEQYHESENISEEVISFFAKVKNEAHDYAFKARMPL